MNSRFQHAVLDIVRQPSRRTPNPDNWQYTRTPVILNSHNIANEFLDQGMRAVVPGTFFDANVLITGLKWSPTTLGLARWSLPYDNLVQGEYLGCGASKSVSKGILTTKEGTVSEARPVAISTFFKPLNSGKALSS